MGSMARGTAVLLLMVAGSGARAGPCDRTLFPASVQVAMADSIVAGRIAVSPDGFGARAIEVDVERVLKGTLATGRAILHVGELWNACGGGALRVGGR